MLSLKNILREIFLDLLSVVGNLFFLFSEKPKIEPSKIKKILIVKLYALGDCVYTSPMVANLRANFPNAKVYWLVKKYSRVVVEHIEGVDGIIEWQTPKESLKKLQAKKFDMAFSTYRSPLAQLVLWFARIPIRVGFAWKGRGFSLTHKIKFRGDILESDRYLKLIEDLGFPIKTRERRLVVGKEEKEAIEDKARELGIDLAKRPLVAIVPGGGDNPQLVMPMKRWAADRFAAVADYLIENKKAQVVLVGSPSEVELAERVQSFAKNKLINITGTTKLEDFVALISLFDLFIAVDTGPVHMSSALGVPTIGLYGPSNPDILEVATDKNIILRKDKKQPEYVPDKVFLRNFAGKSSDPVHPSMMKIEVQDVINEIDKLI